MRINTLESVAAQKVQMEAKNIPFEREAVYNYLKNNFIEMEETPEQIWAMFAEMFPDKDFAIRNEEEIQHRQALSADMREAYLQLGVNRNLVKNPPKTDRKYLYLFRDEVDQASIDFNKKLYDAIVNKDWGTVQQTYSDYIENLPSYDPEQLMNISDEELREFFIPLVSLHTAVQEAENVIKEGLFDHLSEAAQKRVLEFKKDMDLFTFLKLRCDVMANPHFAYVDTAALYSDPKNLESLANGNPESTATAQTLTSLQSLVTFGYNGLPRQFDLFLQSQGINPDNVVYRDNKGVQHGLVQQGFDPGCKNMLMNGEPVVCTIGDQTKLFTYREGKFVELDAAVTMADSVAETAKIAGTSDERLNNSTADPFWMITSSSEYRRMQSAQATYQKLTKDGIDAADPEALNENLKQMEQAARDYFERKKVDLEDFHDYNRFRGSHPSAQKMSKRELARMEAAYTVLHQARETQSTLSLRNELRQQPSVMQNEKNNVAPLTYNEKVALANQNVAESKFLNDPIESAEGNRTAENLRDTIKESLLNPENGLLNKKVFTKQDRQAVSDLMAQVVVLNIIRSGYKLGQPPVDMENAYQTQPNTVLSEVKQNDAFQKAMGIAITPNGLRDYFNNQGYIAVTKSFMQATMKLNAEADKKLEKQVVMIHENVNENELNNAKENENHIENLMK